MPPCHQTIEYEPMESASRAATPPAADRAHENRAEREESAERPRMSAQYSAVASVRSRRRRGCTAQAFEGLYAPSVHKISPSSRCLITRLLLAPGARLPFL